MSVYKIIKGTLLYNSNKVILDTSLYGGNVTIISINICNADVSDIQYSYAVTGYEEGVGSFRIYKAFLPSYFSKDIICKPIHLQENQTIILVLNTDIDGTNVMYTIDFILE